ncbi:hypothetical protein [Flavobacterium sp. J27]|uniref:hypothetical protein n=1 Tax=Flavobacterium sp. J27 TaxID=2060419 RepID=UPI00102F7B50|nr:hypothetical protein [Flavobacterium sp. J27]
MFFIFGLKSLFRTDNNNNQFVTTRFLILGPVILPLESYFVYNKKIVAGTPKIPLNGKNVLKNYLAIYLSLFAIAMVLFNFFLNRSLLLEGDFFSFAHRVSDLNLPLNLIEKVLTLGILGLVYYVIFKYGNLSKEDLEERNLFKESEYCKTRLPGKNLIPLLYKYYGLEEQKAIKNQLIALFYNVQIKKTEEEIELFKTYDIKAKMKYYNQKLDALLSSQAYLNLDRTVIAHLFMITAVTYHLEDSPKNKMYYEQLKQNLLS